MVWKINFRVASRNDPGFPPDTEPKKQFGQPQKGTKMDKTRRNPFRAVPLTRRENGNRDRNRMHGVHFVTPCFCGLFLCRILGLAEVEAAVRRWLAL